MSCAHITSGSQGHIIQLQIATRLLFGMLISLSNYLINLFFFIRNLRGPVCNSFLGECGDTNTINYLKQLEFHNINITINKILLKAT